MTTIRLQVVDAAATALSSATGLPFHRNLDFALEDGNLPALVLHSGDDSPDGGTAPLGILDQVVDLHLDILIAKSANPEAAADPYEAAVHKVLTGNPVLAGQIVSGDRISGAWEFDLSDCAVRRLIYRIGYRTKFTDLEQ